MDDGFYAVTYVGVAGMGLCALLLEGGKVRGFDMMGGQYDGTYTRAADGMLDVKATLLVQPGVELVTGIPAQDKVFPVPLAAQLPANADEGMSVAISVGGRQAEASFKRMRGL